MPSAWGAEGIKQSIDQVQYFTGSPENKCLRTTTTTTKDTTRSYCPVDSISSVVHTLIHAQAKETRNLWGRPAKQYCSEKNDHGIHHEFDSVYVSGTGLHPLQIRLIPYAWCACNLSNSHHLLKKREVQRGKQTAPGPHISGGGRTPVEVHWVAKHDIACDV